MLIASHVAVGTEKMWGHSASETNDQVKIEGLHPLICDEREVFPSIVETVS